MLNQTNDIRPLDCEQPPQGNHSSTTLSSHNEQELDSGIGHRNNGAAIVDVHRHDGLRHDARRYQWADAARRSARSPNAHAFGATATPASPSRIPIPTYAQAVVRHYTPRRRTRSLPRNEGMWNLHQTVESLQEEEDEDAAMERHPANTPLSQSHALPRNEGRMNLYEPGNNVHQAAEDDLNPATPLVRSPRIWNFTDIHESIRQNEENNYDPPTPPPPYHEAVLMPWFDVKSHQTSRCSINGGNIEDSEEQVGRPSFFRGFRRLNSPHPEPSRISHPTSLTSALTQYPPPRYRFSSEHSSHRATQTQNTLPQSEARASNVFGAAVLPQGVEARGATNSARGSSVGSRQSSPVDSEDKDENQNV